MSFPQTTNMLSVKTSLHYFHDEDNTKYYAAYTGKSGNSSGKVNNKNVKAYSLLFNGEQIDFKNLEIIEIWCKDLSERDWRKLNPEVVDSMCCLLNPAPGLYKIHFFNKKGNASAQAFTYSTMIFRIIMHCENKNGVWQGTLPVRINTRSSALKSVWKKELKGKGTSGRPKKRARLSSDSDSDSDGDLVEGPLGSQLSRPSVFSHMPGSIMISNQHNTAPIISSFNSRNPIPTMISTDDMIIGGGDDNSSGEDDDQRSSRKQEHDNDV